MESGSGDLGLYIFKNVEDGVLLLSHSGDIISINGSAQRMLGLENGGEGKSFVSRGFLLNDGRNDDFYQAILDALYEKGPALNKKTAYFPEGEEKRILHIKSSRWASPQDEKRSGVLLIMQDVTQEEKLIAEKRDAILVFSVILLGLSLWILSCVALEHFGVEIPPFAMTYLLLAMGLVIALVIHKKTSLNIRDMGLAGADIKKTLLLDGGIALSLCLVMAGAKLILVRCGWGYFPQGAPFWDFEFTLGMKLYPLSVLLQEFVAQGLIHECLIRITGGGRSRWGAILLSSLLFCVLHIHRGFGFMLSALLLVCLTGMLYQKQRTIWGICIAHYMISMAAFFLNWL